MSTPAKIRVAKGITLVSVEELILRMPDTGLDQTSMLRFLKLLQVPIIRFADKDVSYVRLESFQLAILEITKVGRKDFLAPPTDLEYGPTRRILRHPRAIKQWRTKINAEDYKENFQHLVTELLFSKASSGEKITVDSVRQATTLIGMIRDWAIQFAPLQAQAKQEAKYLKEAKRVTGLNSFEQRPEQTSEEEPNDRVV